MPAPSRSSYLWANGLRVHFLAWGAPGEGVPAVLLHGLASNARFWERVAPRLAAAGFQPIALEMRGHGLTDKPPGDYGFDTFSRDLCACLNALDVQRPLLIGHSWGAWLAVDHAARFPAGPLAPRAVVLVDGGLTQIDQIPGASWESTRQRLTPPPLAGMPVAEFTARVRESNRSWGPDEEALEIILANFEISADERITPRLSFENHMQIVRAMWEFKTHERLRRLRCPAMAVLAEPFEPLSPPELEMLEAKRNSAVQAQAALPGLQVHWLAETAHDIPLQRPAELAGLILRFAAGPADARP